MAKKRRHPSESALKVLFAKSGNLCAFPKCDQRLIADEQEASKPLGEMAHIIAAEDHGPRGDATMSEEERCAAENFILLCPTHHSLIDKFPYQYNTHVLREMKRVHEARFEKLPDSPGHALYRECLYASFLPITRLPKVVFSANTKYRKSNVLELFDAIDAKNHRNVTYAFELREQRLYTFFDLSSRDNPFIGSYDSDTVCVHKAADMWNTPENHRLYVSLLNRALSSLLKRKGVSFNSDHKRYFFQADQQSIERKFTYKSLAGVTSSPSVVHQPITKISGQPKSFWIHYAANLSFQHVGHKEWVLTIRPERHLTKNGFEPYDHSSVGRRITRIKSTMYNWQYLQQLQLWREFLTDAKPRKSILFMKQTITIENCLLNGVIEWPGIPEDQRNLEAQVHDEDLFTSAELREIEDADAEFSSEIDEELLLEENEL
ncbi:MAG: hypothetical protein JW725_03475 [Candidatus Babeliaceae bacterium]|nr:hypothetical protein [Candidatus Babeliaceae bacterium]